IRIAFIIPGSAIESCSERVGDSSPSSMIFAWRQANELRRQGLVVDVFTLTSRTSPWILLTNFLHFRRQVTEWHSQVVHAHFGTVTALFAVLASRLLNTVDGSRRNLPVVITYRGSDLNPVSLLKAPRAFLGRVFSQVAALGATQLVCVSAALRRQLWWRQSSAVVLPSGVDITRFQPLPQPEVRNRLGWPLDVPVLLFNAGHDARNKRLDVAEAVFEIVRREIPMARLEVMRGEVPPDMVPDLMNAADCLLLTSDREGSPTVIQEALACNLPIVSVEVGDIVERLAGVRGAHICSRNPATLAAAVAGMLSTRQRSEGKQRAAEVASTRIANELARLYRESIG
ncbi:MAG: glycosyltransferase, partial [Acidobacteriota bacterium]